MRSKSLRDSILFTLIGILALYIMFYMAVRVEGNLPAYSVLNKSVQGYSVYMASLQGLEIETRQTRGAVEAQPVHSVQIVAYGWWFDGLEPSMTAWVREGGILVISAPEPPVSVAGGQLVSEKNGIRV